MYRDNDGDNLRERTMTLAAVMERNDSLDRCAGARVIPATREGIPAARLCTGCSMQPHCFPLGVRRRDPFRELTVEFATGDRLILYSDGLIEAVDDDGEPFGFDRFERVLSDAGHMSADEIKKSLLAAVKKFTHNRPPEDDQTLVVVSFDEVVAQRAYPGRVAVHTAEAVN